MEKIAKIKELKELLSSGTINQEEFNQLKGEVVSGVVSTTQTNNDYKISDEKMAEMVSIREKHNEEAKEFQPIEMTKFQKVMSFLGSFVSPKDTSDDIINLSHSILAASTKSPVTERIFYGKEGRPMND